MKLTCDTIYTLRLLNTYIHRNHNSTEQHNLYIKVIRLFLMRSKEMMHIFVAFVVLVALIIAPMMFFNASPTIPEALLFAFIILLVAISSKKMFAFLLESEVEHQIWTLERWGLHKQDKFKKPLPLGIILPIIITLFSFGTARLMSLLTYETTPKKTVLSVTQKYTPMSL